jgi:hypothetical protein
MPSHPRENTHVSRWHRSNVGKETQKAILFLMLPAGRNVHARPSRDLKFKINLKRWLPNRKINKSSYNRVLLLSKTSILLKSHTYGTFIEYTFIGVKKPLLYAFV